MFISLQFINPKALPVCMYAHLHFLKKNENLHYPMHSCFCLFRHSFDMVDVDDDCDGEGSYWLLSLDDVFESLLYTSSIVIIGAEGCNILLLLLVLAKYQNKIFQVYE